MKITVPIITLFLGLFLNPIWGQEKGNYSKGLKFYNEGEYDSALVYLNKANPSIYSYKYKAEAHISLLHYQNALVELEKGLALADSLKDATQKVPLLITFGSFYKSQEEEDNALRQYFFAKSIAEENDMVRDIQTINHKISSAYLNKINTEYDSLKITQLVDSILFYTAEPEVYYKETNNKKELAEIYSIQGSAFLNIEEYNKADELFALSSDIQKKNKYWSAYGHTLRNWAVSNFNQGNTAESEQQLLETIQLADSIDDQQLRLVARHNISFVYQDKKEFQKALDYYMDYAVRKDSLDKVSQADELSQFEAQLNNQVLESENALEKAKRLEASLKAKKSQSMVFGLGGALLLTILGLLFFNQYHRFKQRNLHFQLYEKEQEAEISAINAMIDGREEERRTIAAALHDSVTTMLASANMHVEAYKLDHDVDSSSLERAQGLIDDVTDKVRNLSHSLVSAVLIQFGLDKAVQDICEKITTSQLSFDCNLHLKQERFPQEFEVKVFGIIEELANNIIKHSKADQADIFIRQSDEGMTIRVIDNGEGFDVYQSKLGLGLGQIRARVKSLLGTTVIDSEPQEGTTVIITIPPKAYGEKAVNTSV